MRLKSGLKNIKGLGSPGRGSLRTPSNMAIKSNMILRSSKDVGGDLKGLRSSRAQSGIGSLRQAHSGLMGFVKGLK